MHLSTLFKIFKKDVGEANKRIQAKYKVRIINWLVNEMAFTEEAANEAFESSMAGMFQLFREGLFQNAKISTDILLLVILKKNIRIRIQDIQQSVGIQLLSVGHDAVQHDLMRFFARTIASKLNEQEAKIITLYFLNGLSTDEIAILLGLPSKVLTAMKSRIINKIRKFLLNSKLEQYDGWDIIEYRSNKYHGTVKKIRSGIIVTPTRSKQPIDDVFRHEFFSNNPDINTPKSITIEVTLNIDYDKFMKYEYAYFKYYLLKKLGKIYNGISVRKGSTIIKITVDNQKSAKIILELLEVMNGILTVEHDSNDQQERLKTYGLPQSEISFRDTTELSTVEVMDGNKIYLEKWDYAFELPPQELAIYLFFLHIEKGAKLSALHKKNEFKELICTIYLKLKNSHLKKQSSSVHKYEKDLKDSFETILLQKDGRLNQIIAKIKARFVKGLPNCKHIKEYLIQGDRGGNYRIPINRELVIIDPKYQQIFEQL